MHVRFSYQALTAGRYEVGIAGDFTHWKILSLQDFGGLYLIDFDLKPGRYRYKYIIDGVWKTDPANKLLEADPFGGFNSIVVVEEEKSAQNWEEALEAASGQDARSFINCYRPAPDALELRFSWYAGLADEISLIFSDQELNLYPLGRSSGLMIWHRQIPIERPRRFHVHIKHGKNAVYLGLEGFVQHKEEVSPLMVDPSSWPVFEIPEWLKSSIAYQIFPDRFCNGDPKNDPDFSESYYQSNKIKPKAGELLGPHCEYFHLVKDWRDISGLKQSPWQEEGIPDWHSFYGGDIAGVIQHLDYLEDTGINLIYFNPLWEAKSNHKYDAAHFKKLDPHFGSVSELQKLVVLAHDKGIRIILDVAFNHSGEAFWAFRDTVEKGPDSPYWHWYDWYKWPLPEPLPPDFKPRDYYQCWWGIKDMPDLNYDFLRQHPFENYIRDINNAEVNWDLVNHILDAASWWISEIGMDGFRLDVPDEVPWWFWQLFRERMKALKPDAWLVGEIWSNAQAWISEKYFDSVMNYAYFKNPVLEFFVQKLCSAKEFKLKIEEGLAAYPAHANRVMMNLVGSHDTLRIRRLAEDDIHRIKQAIFFQMTFVGIPHIYYGDEIYMDGGKDPDNRRPFNWDWEADPKAVELRSFYQEMIRFRRAHRLLYEGEFEFIRSCPSMISYRRYNARECLYCAINLANQDKMMPGTGEILFGTNAPRRSAEGIILPPGAMCILGSFQA
ncbi:MAG: alpha-amylase family glycosyl hydrolase [Candidatus Cloacimonetes bacterium]|jgi:glycosidase|nr:alpha-amylase family glycosyl hydrolase [Candidatus Cloacimonadota bacterium]MDD2506029.1 alpha-amylase family glycosyl hydrolase [Candidatus Cloacimonadota bacterium]MDD4146927.1 alpha-amylase family glycosyl hydrolase [Candidatus Cloacimonadota bacterium]MDD4559581.1 alpha-amylase family glycosyl hydrolase [Candidatus Cloacimonadota bacterium]